jgi:hypothetical protein
VKNGRAADRARWKSLVESNKLNEAEQYWAEDFMDVAHSLIIYDPNKSIIARNGVIVDAFANMYTSF